MLNHFFMDVPYTWLVIGAVLILLELLADGSKIFFLPLGLAALVVFVFSLLVAVEVLPFWLLPNSWYWVLLIWAALAIAASYLLAWKSRNSQTDSSDINVYDYPDNDHDSGHRDLD